MSSFRWQISSRRVALANAGWNFLLITAVPILAVTTSATISWETVPWALSSAIYSLLAVLILTRQPRHTIGWLFIVIGFLNSYVFTRETLFPQYEPEHALIYFLFELRWIIPLFTPVTLILLYFPDGRLPSRRWRSLPVVAVLSMLAMDLGFQPSVLGDAGGRFYQDHLSNLDDFLIVTSIVGSLAAVLVRYLRSHDHERLQMKWLVYTAVVAILLMLSGSLVLSEDSPVLSFVSVMVPSLIATAIGIAILRYRLFDIDIIIRRTIQYSLLTGILALVYFSLVITLQTLFAAVGDVQSEIFIVISTLVIAGLFNPLRQRVQKAVDRRFYRGKYDAERTLAQFAAVARDEVDLEKLTAALLEVVEETMQPASVGLSLTSDEIVK